MVVVGANLLSSNRLATEAEDSNNPQNASDPEIAEIVSKVNAAFRKDWDDRGLEVANRATDLELARRLSLGLTGTVPSLEELRSFEARPADQRVAWWLQHLGEDRRTADYVAERFARAFVGTENGPFLVYRRRRFVSWLSEELDNNRPYDQIVRQLVAGDGLWTDSPAVNFLTVTLDDNEEGEPDPIRLAGRTTRAFLGMRIDCLQCHDDRLGNLELGTADDRRYGLQSDFHQLAAFFGDAELSLLGVKDNDERKYRYQYLEATEEQVINAAVPFAGEFLSGEGTKRQRLANWVTSKKNKAFARATVNRVWAMMCGRPLHDPIDDIPLHGPFPPGLELLAEDFIEHDFDIHRLVYVIASTDVYQRSSAADFQITSEHEAAWAVFPLSRLRPEQVAGAMIQSCTLTTINAEAHIFSQLARFFEQNDFVQRYGDVGEDEFDERAGTVTQRLLMMNGDLLKQRTGQNMLRNAASRIAALAPDDRKAVETAYLCILTRRPTQRELQTFVSRLEGKRGAERQQQMEDLYWVLLNSTEFSWNH